MNTNRIRAARMRYAESNGRFTQAQAAEFFGVSLGTYRNWEQGRTETNAGQLCRLADKYGVTVDYLLARTDDPRGYRASGAQAPDSVHKQLIACYDSASDDGRDVIMSTATLAARR